MPLRADRIKINGIKAIKASAGESAASLANKAGVKLSDFLTWNEISRNTPLEADQYYLLGKKRTRGEETYHNVSPGENLWQISQRYGVQQKKLRRFNRMRSNEEIKPGMTLWLASKKPKDSGKAIDSNQIIEVDKAATFAWTADSSPPEYRGEAKTTETPLDKPVSTEISVVQEDSTIAENSTQKPLDSAQTLPQNTVSMMPDSAIQLAETDVVHGLKMKEHVVQPKETLYGIAHTYNVGVMDLVRWNNLNLQDGIKPGQVLKLSESAPVTENLVEKPSIEHEVRTTDTLYSIARKYGVTIKDLMEWNNKKNFSLAIGEKLKIQGK
jgi:membrane-bound lytic murein transglycosylase D